MKLELSSLQDLESVFLFPFVTQNKGNTFQKVTFTFTDLASGNQYGEQFDISKVPQQQIHTTFSHIKSYFAIDDITRLEDLLSTVYMESDLYAHSAHKLDILFETSNANLALTKYFIIQNIAQATPYLISVPMKISGNTLQYGFVVPKQDSSGINVLSTHSLVIINAKWTDILLYDNVDVENKTFSATINVAGYDMTRITFMVLGENVQQTGSSLYGYNTVDQGMILIPSVGVKKAKTYSDASGKHLPMTAKISSEVFDGLQYKDYGALFWNRGINFKITGNAQIGVNRQIGSEYLSS